MRPNEPAVKQQWENGEKGEREKGRKTRHKKWNEGEMKTGRSAKGSYVHTPGVRQGTAHGCG